MYQVSTRPIKRSDQPSVEELYEMYWAGQEFKNKLIKRLGDFFDQTKEIIESNFRYFVATDREEIIVGVVGIRNVSESMQVYTTTEKALEIYVLASRDHGKGIGKILVNRIISLAKEENYHEIILYSGITHKESWDFYEHIGFYKVQESIAPDGETGTIWRKYL